MDPLICYISMYMDGTDPELLCGNIVCDACYTDLMSFLPSRRMLFERTQLFKVLKDATETDHCLVHPRRDPMRTRIRKKQACCRECRAAHDREVAQASHIYLLACHMELPRELGREIMWFAVRV
jgi:hypothetical protein